jgi:MmoB/DmpM family protein
MGHAILAAIRRTNANVTVEDRGSYLRVLVPGSCVVSRAAIEAEIGRPFRLPGELEQVMPSFKGTLELTSDVASWSLKVEP